MEILKLSLSSFDRVVKKTVACLRAGGVIAAPTETVYGLMTCWENDAGRERIYRLKGRDKNKLLQMLAAGADAAATGGHVSPDERLTTLVERFCPGALTIVTPGPGGSVGLRVPDCPFILAVLKELGGPLAATSANRSGTPPALTAEAAVADLQGEHLFEGATSRSKRDATPGLPGLAGRNGSPRKNNGVAGEPDLLIDGGPTRAGTASTVVSLMNPEMECLREGPIAFEDILARL